jgi:predicted DNA-binding transcriptional regulator AlpA
MEGTLKDAIAEKEVALPETAYACRLLSPRQVQAMFGISKRKLYDMLASKGEKKIPSLKLGKARKFRLDKILWWLEKLES